MCLRAPHGQTQVQTQLGIGADTVRHMCRHSQAYLQTRVGGGADTVRHRCRQGQAQVETHLGKDANKDRHRYRHGQAQVQTLLGIGADTVRHRCRHGQAQVQTQLACATWQVGADIWVGLILGQVRPNPCACLHHTVRHRCRQLGVGADMIRRRHRYVGT